MSLFSRSKDRKTNGGVAAAADVEAAQPNGAAQPADGSPSARTVDAVENRLMGRQPSGRPAASGAGVLIAGSAPLINNGARTNGAAGIKPPAIPAAPAPAASTVYVEGNRGDHERRVYLEQMCNRLHTQLLSRLDVQNLRYRWPWLGDVHAVDFLHHFTEPR